MGAAFSSPQTIQFDVDAPSWSNGQLFVAIDQPVNSSAAWTANAVPLSPDPSVSQRWVATLSLPPGTTVQFKITRGDWSLVEKGPQGEELPNRTITVGSSATTAFAHVFHWADDQAYPPANATRELGPFTPRKLGTSRLVYAHLPPGYDDPANAQTTYPVLYVLDGQNMFDPARAAFGVVWGLDVAADGNAAAGRGAFIAIAIDNTPARIDEYTPSFDASVGGGGRLEDFARFVIDELKPEIDRVYRTKSGPDDTGIMGSSLGGLAALRIGLAHSDVVRRIGAVSPSAWWNNEETKNVIAGLGSKPPLKIWLDVGTNEGSNPQATVAQVKRVNDALAGLGFGTSGDLTFQIFPGASHNEASWAARLPDILGWLFP